MNVFKAGAIAISVTFCLGASGLPVSAQSLTDALISAYRNSSQMEIDRAALRGVDEGVAQAVAATRPSVSASLSGISAYSIPGAGSAFAGIESAAFYSTLSLSASLTLWDGGNTRLGISVARENVAASRANLMSTEQTVLLNAVVAFMDMHRDMQFLALAENNLEVLARQVQAAQDRYDVGEVRKTDVNLAEAAFAAAQASVAQAQGALEISREAYNIAVGVYPGRLQAPPPLPRLPATLVAAKDIAMRNHPAIHRAQHVAKTGELNVFRAEAAMKPKVTLSASASATTLRSSSDSVSISLGASMPLYTGGALASAQRQAIALRQQSLASLQLVGKTVAQAVNLYWTQIEITKASIAAKHKQVRASRVALQGIREEASLGASTTLDILNAEQDLVSAESALVSAQHDQYVAVYSLLSAMGLLTVDHLRLGIKTYDVDANYKKVFNAPGPTDRGKLLDKIFTRAGKK